MKELNPQNQTLLETIPRLLRKRNEKGKELILEALAEYQEVLIVDIVQALVEDWCENKKVIPMVKNSEEEEKGKLNLEIKNLQEKIASVAKKFYFQFEEQDKAAEYCHRNIGTSVDCGNLEVNYHFRKGKSSGYGKAWGMLLRGFDFLSPQEGGKVVDPDEELSEEKALEMLKELSEYKNESVTEKSQKSAPVLNKKFQTEVEELNMEADELKKFQKAITILRAHLTARETERLNLADELSPGDMIAGQELRAEASGYLNAVHFLNQAFCFYFSREEEKRGE